jgi:predicted nuclease with TOPRIM domain
MPEEKLGIDPKIIEEIIEEIYYDDDLRERFNQRLKDKGYIIPEPKEKRVEKKVEEKLKKIEEDKKQLETKLKTLESQEKIKRAYEIMDKYGIPRDRILEVEEIAKKAGITNWETACNYYALQQRELRNMVVGKPYMEREKSTIERYIGPEGKTKIKEDLMEAYRKTLTGEI